MVLGTLCLKFGDQDEIHILIINHNIANTTNPSDCGTDSLGLEGIFETTVSLTSSVSR